MGLFKKKRRVHELLDHFHNTVESLLLVYQDMGLTPHDAAVRTEQAINDALGPVFPDMKFVMKFMGDDRFEMNVERKRDVSS